MKALKNMTDMQGVILFHIFILIMMIGGITHAKADSLIGYYGAKSNHLVEGKFNETNHNWKGLGYRFVENDKYSVQGDYVEFINSYYEPTKFIAITGIYTPLTYKSWKLGLSGSIGYQEGYYVSKEGAMNPTTGKRLGIDNRSILLLYSFYAELDNIIINYTYIPDSVEAISFGFKAMEW